MIRTNIFPEDNICYQLFQDVIMFYMHRNIHAMHGLFVTIVKRVGDCLINTAYFI